MKANIKYRTIYRYEEKYSVSAMCSYFGVSRSGYYRWVGQAGKEDRDDALARLIRECHAETRKTYGYRRIKIWLSREKGLKVNHKAILRVMNKTNQLSRIRRRRPWVQYGQMTNRFPNLLNQNFFTAQSNRKWATDITYIPTRQDGILYLSAVKDLCDGSIVAYKMSSTQSVQLVLETIKEACRKEKVADGLVLHSDQGFQ